MGGNRFSYTNPAPPSLPPPPAPIYPTTPNVQSMVNAAPTAPPPAPQVLPPHIQEAIKVMNTPPPTQTPESPSALQAMVNKAHVPSTPVPEVPENLPPSPPNGQSSPRDISTIQTMLTDAAKQIGGQAISTATHGIVPSPTEQEDNQRSKDLALHIAHEVEKDNDWLMQKVNIDYPLAFYPQLFVSTIADEWAKQGHHQGGPLGDLLGTNQAEIPVTQEERDAAYRSFGVNPGWQKYIDDFVDPNIGPHAANQKAYESLDPTSKFIMDMSHSPLTYFPTGGLEKSGLEVAAKMNPGLMADLVRAIVFVDSAPNKLASWGLKTFVGEPYKFMKAYPLFSQPINAVENTVKNFFDHTVKMITEQEANPENTLLGSLQGGSWRGQTNKFEEIIQNILRQFTGQNIDHFAFNQIVNKPFEVNASHFQGFTDTNELNKAQEVGWKALRTAANSLDNYPAKIYAAHEVEMGRAASAAYHEEILGDATLIEHDDPETLQKYLKLDYSDQRAIGSTAKADLIRQLYQAAHVYDLEIQKAVSNDIARFNQNVSPLAVKGSEELGVRAASTPPKEDMMFVHDVLKTMNEANLDAWSKTKESIDTINMIKNQIMNRTANLNTILNHPEMVKGLAAQSPAHISIRDAIVNQTRPDVPSKDFLSEARQFMYSQRNAAYVKNFLSAQDQMTQRFTLGLGPYELKKLVGGSEAMTRQFQMSLQAIQAQAVGHNGMSALLSPELGNFYDRYLADLMPSIAKRLTVDKGQFMKTIYDNQEKILEGLGYSRDEIAQLMSRAGSLVNSPLLLTPAELAAKKIRRTSDLLQALNRTNAIGPDAFNRLNTIYREYQKSGDILFDDPLRLSAGKLVDAFIRQKGPGLIEQAMGKTYAPINLAFQWLFKENTLLTLAYHGTITMQDLVSAWMHGRNPWTTARQVWRAYEQVPKYLKGEDVNVMSLFPKASQDAYELTNWTPHRSITSGGIGSSLFQAGEDLGGIAKNLTASEKVPASWKMGLAAIQSLPYFASGNLPLGIINMIYHSFFNVRLAPILLHANSEVSRAASSIFRVVPHTQGFTEYLKEVAPYFLMDMAEQLDQIRNVKEVSPLVEGISNQLSPENQQPLWRNLFPPGLANDQATGISRPVYDNADAEIERVIKHLWARNGLFSENDIRDVGTMLNIHPATINDLARKWSGHLFEADKRGVDWANHMHFDYGTPSNFEDITSHVVPFYIWFNRLLPFTIQHLAEDPRIVSFLVNFESAIRNANLQAGRGANPKYNEQMQLPEPFNYLSDFISNQHHSYLTADPLSMILPGTGMYQGDVDPNSPVGNQILTVMSNLGMDPFWTVPFILNTISAISEKAGGAPIYNSPPPNFIRQTGMDNMINRYIFQPASAQLMAALGNPTHLNPITSEAEKNITEEDYLHQIYEAPRLAMGLPPESYTDIAVKRRLAEQSRAATGTSNSPMYAMAANNPNSMLYRMAQADVQRQQELSGMLRTILPMRTSIVSPKEQDYDRQHQDVMQTYGPQVADLIERYLPSRYPDYNMYDSANHNPNIPIGKPGQWPLPVALPPPQKPDLDINNYIMWLQTAHVPVDQWFNQDVINQYQHALHNVPLQPNQDMTVGLH